MNIGLSIKTKAYIPDHGIPTAAQSNSSIIIFFGWSLFKQLQGVRYSTNIRL